ncbi:membrane protein, putative [Geotalea daltonii FRC-32]|uniref:Membrane protein, putative n=1 Tax=Geotalea daltonii (strain DSM 22248 / JCM 15807 / FRC-32) TaxID=316067 RepID=B9M8Y7_GEODF|nr:MATE family efflux transporter [Geotalea daltonii]ACM20483.1 membrane protein, putative [Geotalea daltonii FRC-32]
MKLAVVAGWIARALVIILSLVNSRLLIDLVGVEGLAVQSILVSLTTWFTLLNFGIPQAVQNLISRCRAEGHNHELLKQTASSALVVIFVVLLPVVMLLGVAIRHFVLARYPGVATITVILFCVGLFIAGLSVLFNLVLYAEQRGHWPNLYPAVNSLFVTGSLIAFRFLAIYDINQILLILVIGNLLVAAIGALQAGVYRRWSLDRHILKEIWHHSRGFALFSFLAAGVLGIDYLVMSRVLAAHDIAVYNICQRVFMALFSVHAIILTSAWSSVSETLFAKQWELARKKIRSLLIIGGGMVIILGSFIMIFMENIADIVSHHVITLVPVSLTSLFVIYMLLRVWSDTYAMALLSFNETNLLNRYVPVQAIVSILAQIVLGKEYGSTGIMLGLILSFAVTSVWILPKAFYHTTRERACD